MTGAAVWFAFGVLTAALSLQYPLGTLRAPGSGLFPLALGVMLMALAAAHAVKLRLERPKEAPPEPPVAPEAAAKTRADARRRVALFVGVMALAAGLLPHIGYVASSFLLMLGLLRVLGVRWGLALLIAGAAAIASHFLFVRWLSIPMPPGPLGF
jgi:hypothetical protein